jgi:hypothetical protein
MSHFCFFLKVDRHTLFDDNFKDKFFPAYGLIKFQTIKWTFIPFAKKFFIAIAIGFFIDYYPAQLAIIAFILILYVSECLQKIYILYSHDWSSFEWCCTNSYSLLLLLTDTS